MVDALQPGNGTTASTLRFSHALRDQGHEVRLLSVESTPVPSTRGIPVVGVPVLYLPLITHLADLQNVDLARPVRAIVSSAVAEADLVHVVMPSLLGACAKHVAQHAGVPVTAGFHIQPENITYNVHLANLDALPTAFIACCGWRSTTMCPTSMPPVNSSPSSCADTVTTSTFTSSRMGCRQSFGPARHERRGLWTALALPPS